jgi:transcriptional regulator with XRE-family HTH domain
MDIAKRIIQLCEERNISIYKLADLSCLTQSTLQNIVSGRNTSILVSTLEKICNGLDITLIEFFSETEPPTLPPEGLKELKAYEEYLINKYNAKSGN